MEIFGYTRKMALGPRQTLIANSLRKHRQIMGYTQIEVARLLELNSTARISRWEKGVALPNVINLIKLSIIYRTFPNELYFDLLMQLRQKILRKEKIVFDK